MISFIRAFMKVITYVGANLGTQVATHCISLFEICLDAVIDLSFFPKWNSKFCKGVRKHYTQRDFELDRGGPSQRSTSLTLHNLLTPHCCSAPSDWSLIVSAGTPSHLSPSPWPYACRGRVTREAVRRCAAVSQGCIMPPCVPPGLSDAPSTRTNRGGPSGCSSWGRPRECALSRSSPSPTHLSLTSVLNKSHVWMSAVIVMV